VTEVSNGTPLLLLLLLLCSHHQKRIRVVSLWERECEKAHLSLSLLFLLASIEKDVEITTAAAAAAGGSGE